MKKKLALGIGLAGAGLLALSLTVFGMGAAATLNPAAPDSPSVRAAEAAVVPAEAVTPTPTGTLGTSVTSEAGAIEAADNSDPMASEAFKAMTPDEQANGREWVETQTITAACMKDKGFVYTFEPFWERDSAVLPVMWEDTLPTSERAAARLALDGDTGGGADYHWDDAGCWGYAVHVMGNDNNH
ncbi:hypothetical protein [Cryobacterium sp. TMT3-29-2]|uniref:hypothetical protein n=1 Tax=Cryobacterium sp. TMT3-29-2 TaxID=2555867 RepID=UPI001073E65B|nr:hypothetical protein [Cryobacterium sp. TMT3-29-2]TFC82409.1 hypothetical protein E3O67_16580 [Cryobacterium sp. TMT3-29-2]